MGVPAGYIFSVAQIKTITETSARLLNYLLTYLMTERGNCRRYLLALCRIILRITEGH